MRHLSVNCLFAFSLLAMNAIASAEVTGAYQSLAAIASEPTFDASSSDRARDLYTDGSIMARKELELQELQRLANLDSLETSRDAIVERLSACHETLLEIRRLDANTPDYQGIAEHTLDAAPGLLKKQEDRSDDDKDAIQKFAIKGILELGSAVINSYQLSTQKENYRANYARARADGSYIMANLSKSQYRDVPQAAETDPTIHIDVHYSMATTYINDLIDLRNDSGKDLTSCTLVVTVEGEKRNGDAEQQSHFHFVGRWPAGETRYVWYPSAAHGGIATDESTDIIRRVSIDFGSDQIRGTTALVISREDYDAEVKRWADEHLTPSTFSGRWYTNSENLVDPAGFQVTFNGEPSFCVEKVTVVATKGDENVSIYDASPTWVTGDSGKKWICHKNFNAVDDPDTVKLLISFPGSAYLHEVLWDRRAAP